MVASSVIFCSIRASFRAARWRVFVHASLLIAGILSAIGASICCVGPLVLLALGVSGAWIGSLTALEPYRPIFIGLGPLSIVSIWYAQPAHPNLPALIRAL
jgi:MerT mercuric transport protein